MESWVFSSGPDLSYIHSYTSILRLGFAAWDTPDVPSNQLGTRGTEQHAPRPELCLLDRDVTRGRMLSSGVLPEHSITPLRIQQGYVFPYLNNRIAEDHGEDLAPKITETRRRSEQHAPRPDLCLSDRDATRGRMLSSGVLSEHSITSLRIQPGYVFPYLNNRIAKDHGEDIAPKIAESISPEIPDVGEYAPGYALLHRLAPL
ncbi:hypothetical protein F511_13006 [Dorcoceras hygrometricum]|uniref:Uncharacterized protein n=1 Tax=Dorcoceras hygrometricum TaxID=472368 RepID=A0A2Z7BEQ6_9LAMI|nr:hypothetical protein F511_13006 [Dorcoceras hygrometricum]